MALLTFSKQSLLYLSLLVLLFHHTCSSSCSKQTSKGYLTVTIVRGWNLKGDFIGRTEAYVKMWYANYYRRTRMINSNYPYWNTRYYLGNVDTNRALRIQVWDEDVSFDDLLVSCVRYLSSGTHRFTCYSGKGRIEIRYTLTCARHLTGNRCEQFKSR